MRSNIFNEDFRDFLLALNEQEVRGLDFDTCYQHAVYFEDDDLRIRTIHKESLVVAKKQSGRPKDLDDLENLGA